MKLEELFKDKWTPILEWGENSVMLGKSGERIIYDRTREEIIIRYSTDLKRYLKNE